MPSLIKQKIDVTNFEQWKSTATSCKNSIFFGLDLRHDDQKIAALDQACMPQEGALFLGCHLGPALLATLGQHHGLLFPIIPQAPHPIYRNQLYTTSELLAGYDPECPSTYFQTLDWTIYLSETKLQKKEASPKLSAEEMLARSLHDHFIQEQLHAYLESLSSSPSYHGAVAIMGGHNIPRSASTYREVVFLARQLTQEGFLIMTGGGPGIMEAANLGAWLAPFEEEEVASYLAELTVEQALLSTDPLWLSTAWKVRKKSTFPDSKQQRSLALATWFYVKETANIFATQVAKFFENSIRENLLLTSAKQGLVYVGGGAGTVQEIFQASCQNYYNTSSDRIPMLFLEQESSPFSSLKEEGFCYETPLLWPLLEKLAKAGNFEDCLIKTSDRMTALHFIKKFSMPDDLRSL